MSEIVQELMRKEDELARILSLPPDQQGPEIRRLKQAYEARSPFKLGQLVRTCDSPGISLVGGITELPHDHDDPEQHSDTRVVSWSVFGNIKVATPYGDNPHCCECGHSESHMVAREAVDWADKSLRKKGEKVSYKWELTGFWDSDKHIGDVVPAILVVPHIKEGDWIVRYGKPEKRNDWITRVINERQMLPPLPDSEYPTTEE